MIEHINASGKASAFICRVGQLPELAKIISRAATVLTPASPSR